MRTHYRFNDEWLVDAGADAVRALLEDVAGYGAWWRGVRVVGDLSTAAGRAAELEVRAPAGYRIRFTLTESFSSRDELRALIAGDLQGWCAWRIGEVDDGTRVAFVQEVEARAPLLRLASPLLHRHLAAQHGRLLRGAAEGMQRALHRPDSHSRRSRGRVSLCSRWTLSRSGVGSRRG